MKTLGSFFARRLREYVFLISSLPVAIFFFALVNIGFSAVFLPLAVLLFLALLSIMQWVARVEIRRTNAILKEIPPYYFNPIPGAHYLKVELT